MRIKMFRTNSVASAAHDIFYRRALFSIVLVTNDAMNSRCVGILLLSVESAVNSWQLIQYLLERVAEFHLNIKPNMIDQPFMLHV